MSEDYRREFQAIGELVEAASVADEVKRTLIWCLGQLPLLYDQLFQTYDIRFSDKILHLEQGIVKELGKEAKKQHDGHKLADDIIVRLKLLHERHGLPSLDPKPSSKRKTG